MRAIIFLLVLFTCNWLPVGAGPAHATDMSDPPSELALDTPKLPPLFLVRRYNGPANKTDEARAMAVDSQGNVYVTGRSKGGTGFFAYATIKYSPNFQQLWVKRFGYALSSSEATAIAVDGQGNVYVTGSSGNDYATIKYSSSGQQLWVSRYNGPLNGNDVATAIALDSQGNVYVTGGSFNEMSDEDYTTVRYSPSGQELKVLRWDGGIGSYDRARAIAVDGQDNVYVTGSSREYSSDYATIKYSPSGDQLWVSLYDYGTYNDVATAIAVNNKGIVYVTGWSESGLSSDDYATIAYNSSGQQLWVKRYNGTGKGYDDATAIAVNNGRVYVTGRSEGLGSGYDYLTIRYWQ